jgi:succinate dehydrogenase hydrophobic anchor subunit
MLNFAQVKKFCISTFIGSLIVAALVAVIAVLLGEFNEVTWRVFATLFVVVVHSLVSLSFIWDDTRNKAFARLSLFINTVFLIIVVSFFLSVFGIWKLIAAETIRHLYVTLFFIGFGSLHVDVLSKVLGKEKYMDAIIYANYVFIAVVLAMLQPIIYVQNADAVLGPVFFRILAAAAIVDGTLSILTMIFYKKWVTVYQLRLITITRRQLNLKRLIKT